MIDMKIERQIEQARYVIDRYDRYLQVIDIKGNFLMAYHFFIVGGLLINYADLQKSFGLCNTDIKLFKVLVLATCIISLVSLVIILLAVYPFLRANSKAPSGKKKKEKMSLIFFGSVATMTFDKFYEQQTTRDEKELLKDFYSQSHTLAHALKRKFERIKYAGLLCYLHVFPAVIAIIYKII